MPASRRHGRWAITAFTTALFSVSVIRNPIQSKLFQEYVVAVSWRTNALEGGTGSSFDNHNSTAATMLHQKQEDMQNVSFNLQQPAITIHEKTRHHSVSLDNDNIVIADASLQFLSSLQYLSRQNISRKMCGQIPKVSTPPLLMVKSDAFPRVLTVENNDADVDNARHHHSNSYCRPNAIVYMVQKGKHSTYGRNSTALFIKSLDLLYRNYLSLHQHSENTDVLIFHSGDYNMDDLTFLHRRYNQTVHFKCIDVSDTDYWTIPESLRYDNVSAWAAHPQFSIGYRHMIRWYALKLYDFVRDYAARATAASHDHADADNASSKGCDYQYIMRMDEDSFLHSPIEYDLFHFMESNNFSYAFRMCSYELDPSAWDDYVDHIHYCDNSDNNNNNSDSSSPLSSSSSLSLPPEIPHRSMYSGLCAFYNNFFIVHMPFMLEPRVQQFLQWTDATGIMYRERYNDLQIQTIAVYAFLPAPRIHRFVDWTYEHITYSKIVKGSPCPSIGSLQAGYLDFNFNATFAQFAEESRIYKLRCPGIRKRNVFREDGMSPTYSHLPPSSWWNETLGISRHEFQWRTIAAGSVERPNRGKLSG